MKKRINRKGLLNFLGIALIIIAVALFGLTMLMQGKEFAERYDELLKMLADFEDAVAAIQIKELVAKRELLKTALQRKNVRNTEKEIMNSCELFFTHYNIFICLQNIRI